MKQDNQAVKANIGTALPGQGLQDNKYHPTKSAVALVVANYGLDRFQPLMNVIKQHLLPDMEILSMDIPVLPETVIVMGNLVVELW